MKELKVTFIQNPNDILTERVYYRVFIDGKEVDRVKSLTLNFGNPQFDMGPEEPPDLFYNIEYYVDQFNELA